MGSSVHPTDSATEAGPVSEPASAPPAAVVDSLVEEVSIDGMCGVY
jgi:mycofactocin precursor